MPQLSLHIGYGLSNKVEFKIPLRTRRGHFGSFKCYVNSSNRVGFSGFAKSHHTAFHQPVHSLMGHEAMNHWREPSERRHTGSHPRRPIAAHSRQTRPASLQSLHILLGGFWAEGYDEEISGLIHGEKTVLLFSL